MGNYRLGLKKMIDKDLSGNRRALIFIKTSHSDESEFRFISPRCATQSELNHQIDKLKAELDTLKKQGERFFNS